MMTTMMMMMSRKAESDVRTPPPSRWRLVLLVLTLYHASLLDTHPPSSSSSQTPPSLFPASTPHHHSSGLHASTSWLWSSWLHLLPKRKRGLVGTGATPTCVMSPNQWRLMEMLNELHTIEELNHERLALQQIWDRDNHNLTGICPAYRPRGHYSLPELEQQSLCPWTLEQNNRPDRIPRLLWFARCTCGHCRTTGTHSSARLYSCVPLYHHVPVIWEVCHDGAIVYSWGQESVPVGCVCAHPSARRVH